VTDAPTNGQQVIDAILALATGFDCRIDDVDRSTPAPAYGVRVSSPLLDRCVVTISFDEPPALANLKVGRGLVRIEWPSPDATDLMDRYVAYVEQILSGRVRERLHYLDDRLYWSEITFLDSGDTHTNDVYQTMNPLQQLLAQSRRETIEYLPYPPIGSQAAT
jgi:hypothetical protein